MGKQEELSPTEKLTKQLITVLSQYRSEQMSQAVKRGMLHRATNGYAVNRPPLDYSTTDMTGFFKVNRLGRALREVLKKLANGETNLESVTIRLALMFYSSNTGLKSWSTTKTKLLLSNPYYAGYISYGDQLYSGQHEPLITEQERQKLLKLLDETGGSISVKSVDKSL